MNESCGAPFFFAGNSTGCLLVHGYSGSPDETRGLAEHLAGRGYTVLGVRLAGHGGSAREFHASRWEDWQRSVGHGFDELHSRSRRVVVVGFSMGGLLGMLLSQHRYIDGLVTMGSRVLVRGHWRFVCAPLLRHTLAWHVPALIPMDELHQLVRRAWRALPSIAAPALVMHGCDDDVVLPLNASVIAGRIGSQQKELVWWDNTGHQMLVKGPYRQAIYERVAAFVEQIHGTPGG